MNREVTQQLMAEIDRLHARVAHMESVMDTVRNASMGLFGGGKVSQRTVLELLEKHDKGAVATGATTFELTLKGVKYHATLEGNDVAVHSDTNPQKFAFDTLGDLDKWLSAQTKVKSMRSAMAAPEGSRLHMYTQAVLAQQAQQARPYT